MNKSLLTNDSESSVSENGSKKAQDATPEREQNKPLFESSSPITKQKKRNFILLLFFIASSITAISPGIVVLYLLLPLPLSESKTVIIPRGATVQMIENHLEENGIPVNHYMFRLTARVIANDNLKAGEYKFEPGINLIDAVLMMHYGQSVIRLLTVPEGLDSHEIVELLNNEPTLTGNIAIIPPEGSLLPETYRYSYGDSREELIERMQKAQQELLETLWKNRDPSLPLKSPKEAVILASIVEKETGKKAEERARVAGVFYNRLRQNMPLQSDPTVIYAITNGKNPIGRELTHKDLRFPSPYNTYINTGLPPSPISNPGRASLEATLHPEKNDFLYFVADGTGGHAFSKDINTHNRNVSKWLGLSKK